MTPGRARERRRRRRLSEYGARLALGLGTLATLMQRREVVAMFPESWQVFIAGGAAVAGIIAGAQVIERNIDNRRRRELEENEQTRTVQISRLSDRR